jgi:hypothetical protein
MEILGSGMVHPAVLEAAGIDSERYTGWAFGMGPGRIAMQRYDLPTSASSTTPTCASSSRWPNERVSRVAQRVLRREGRSATELRDLLTAHTATVEEVVPLRADLAPSSSRASSRSDRIRIPSIFTSRGWTWARASCSTSCAAHRTSRREALSLRTDGHRDAGGLKIEKRKIRGQTSNGMLCSARELGLGQEHEGILELTVDAAPGTPLLQAMPIGDSRLVVDVLPNRPDLLSHLGLAREIAAITGTPSRSRTSGRRRSRSRAEAVPSRRQRGRHRAAPRGRDPRHALHGHRGARAEGRSESAVARRTGLAAVGSRSINNVVDATNYVLHELGSPRTRSISRSSTSTRSCRRRRSSFVRRSRRDSRHRSTASSEAHPPR